MIVWFSVYLVHVSLRYSKLYLNEITFFRLRNLRDANIPMLPYFQIIGKVGQIAEYGKDSIITKHYAILNAVLTART